METVSTSQDPRDTVLSSTQEVDSLLQKSGFPTIRDRIKENSYYSIIQDLGEEKAPCYPETQAAKIYPQLNSFIQDQIQKFPLKDIDTNKFFVEKDRNKKLNFTGETFLRSKDDYFTRIYITPYTAEAITTTQNLVQELRKEDLLSELNVTLNLESFLEPGNLTDNTIIIYKRGKDDEVITKTLKSVKNIIDKDTGNSFPKDTDTLKYLYNNSIKSFSLPFFAGVVRMVECFGGDSYDTNIKPWLLQAIGYDKWNPATTLDIQNRLKNYLSKNPKISFADLVDTSERALKNNPNLTERYLNSPCFMSNIEKV